MAIDPENIGQVQLKGVVTGIFPPKKDDQGDPVKGGYIWIRGEDNVAYFGHITEIRDVDIYDIRIDDECRFLPDSTSKGPAAKRIQFLAQPV